MRVIVPFTELTSETCQSVNATGWTWEPVYVGDSDEDYWSLLAGLWADAEDFLVIEQDIVVNEDTITDLYECDSEWCSVPYDYIHGAYPGLGCAKFEGTLMKRSPKLMVEIGEFSDGTHTRKHWCRLDGWMSNALLQRYNASPCHSHPAVGHVRDYDGPPLPSHGCVTV
jgi:hypothetical protein